MTKMYYNSLMGKLVSYRLNKNIRNKIDIISKQLAISNTKVVEEAILSYSNTLNPVKNKLSKYIGSVDDKFADDLLDDIRNSRKDKKLNVKL